MPVACKLCNKEFERFPKSHIIPDFMYKNLKNEKSQILRTRMPTNTRLKPIFSGFYEKNFLCHACEAKMSKWETYAEKVLYGSSNIPMPKVSHTSDRYLQDIAQIDYQKFKLFLLSILWKASKTSHKFFERVKIGLKHEQAIADMLLAEHAGDELSYPIALFVPKGKVGSSIGILPPYQSKSKANAIRYVFPICEIIYVYHVSSHGIEDLQRTATIKKDDTMKIVFVPEDRTKFLINIYKMKEDIKRQNYTAIFGKRI